jgi:site-specific DNA-methyltransferase (adenine-specific)
VTIEVIHADARELAPENFADFDAMITDPPYSAHVHANATSIGSDGHGARARDLGFVHLTPELRAHLAACGSNVRRWSVVFTDYEGGHDWRVDAEAARLEWIRRLPWIRWSQPQLSGDRPCTGSEDVLHFSNEPDDPDVLHWHAAECTRAGRIVPMRKRWNGPGSLTHYFRRCMRGHDKHPTEKPLDLLLDLVCYFTDPGEDVIDPCAGSGTTGLACRLLGRSATLIEADPAWAAHARLRMRGRLSPRDQARAEEWCASVYDEASSVPEPRAADGSDVKTWERAQRRLADVARVAEAL